MCLKVLKLSANMNECKPLCGGLGVAHVHGLQVQIGPGQGLTSTVHKYISIFSAQLLPFVPHLTPLDHVSYPTKYLKDAQLQDPASRTP